MVTPNGVGIAHGRRPTTCGEVSVMVQVPEERSGEASRPAVEVEVWVLRCLGGTWQSLPAVRIGLDATRHPHDQAGDAARGLGVEPSVVHSTSWRMVDGVVVLTYVVVTDDPLGGSWSDVHRAHGHDAEGAPLSHVLDADRGDAVTAPGAIAEESVVHHALHHLAMLATTNTAIADALGTTARASLAPLAPAPAGVLSASPART